MGFEEATGGDECEFPADDEAFVVDFDDGSLGAAGDHFGDGGLPIAGDFEELVGELHAVASGDPVVVGDGGGADEVELLTEDEGVGEFLVDTGFVEVGAAFVEGAITKEREAEPDHGLAVFFGAIFVIVGEETAAEAVTAIDTATPEGKRLFDGDIAGGAVVIT